MTTSTQLVSLADVKAGFEAIAKLETAAAEIKTKRNDGIMKAYALIIAHLEAIGSKAEKKDKKAKETFDELLKLGVTKAKARRYIEQAQAWRRHHECSPSSNPDENMAEFAGYEIDTEAKMKKFLFGEKTKPWWESAVKAMVKAAEAVIATKGELAAETTVRQMAAELQSEYKKALAESMKTTGTLVDAKTGTGKPTTPKTPPKNQAKKQPKKGPAK